MTENFDTPIKSVNLRVALEFLYRDIGRAYTPDAIKERAVIEFPGDGFTLPHTERIACSHASTGRMLRRAEVKGTVYKSHELKRTTRRNDADTEDIAIFYLSGYTFHPAQYA
jgi:hypothetical protein